MSTQDSVYTSYQWLRAVLIDDGMRVSYSERGAKDNPHIDSMWGRLKTEIGSRIDEAATLAELEVVLADRFRSFNEKRRHSGVSYEPPLTYLNSIVATDEPGGDLSAAA